MTGRQFMFGLKEMDKRTPGGVEWESYALLRALAEWRERGVRFERPLDWNTHQALCHFGHLSPMTVHACGTIECARGLSIRREQYTTLGWMLWDWPRPLPSALTSDWAGHGQ